MNKADRKSPKGLLVREKRNVLGGKITLYCTGFALLHLALDASQQHYKSVLFDGAIATIIFSCYLLNLFKFHRFAKITGLLSLNIAFVIYASVVPKEVGIYLFYFPLVAASSAFFNDHEKELR